MKIHLLAVSALALATPAFAQTASGSVTTQTPPASSAPSASAQADAQAPAPTEAAPAPATDAKSVIAAEFPTYDKDADGKLSRAEFDGWMTALRDKSGQPLAAAEKDTWLKGAFATADVDKSKSVSIAELTTYLTAKS